MYDVSGVTDAAYTNADHTEFSLLLDGVPVEAKAIPGLLLYDALLANEIAIADYVPPAAPPVTSVTPRQARIALSQAGLLDTVQAAIDAAPDSATKITWEYATEFLRDDPLIVSIGAALGLTDEQIDDLFTTAAAL